MFRVGPKQTHYCRAKNHYRQRLKKTPIFFLFKIKTTRWQSYTVDKIDLESTLSLPLISLLPKNVSKQVEELFHER